MFALYFAQLRDFEGKAMVINLDIWHERLLYFFDRSLEVRES
jgi:hypothetical protein